MIVTRRFAAASVFVLSFGTFVAFMLLITLTPAYICGYASILKTERRKKGIVVVVPERQQNDPALFRTINIFDL